jgi:hypothetical protein
MWSTFTLFFDANQVFNKIFCIQIGVDIGIRGSNEAAYRQS